MYQKLPSQSRRSRIAALPKPPGDVLERVSDAVVVLDKSWHCIYLNDQAGHLFGHAPKDLLGKEIWGQFPDGAAEPVHQACDKALAEHRFVQVETYSEPWHGWYESRIFPSADGLVIFFHDIAEQKKAQQATQEDLELLRGQNQVLELIAEGAPLEKTLDTLLRVVERRSPGMLASILLLESDGTHVRHGAAPSLPETYVKAIDGEPIGPCAGSCGTAMYRGEQVIVEDIATDPLWSNYRRVALKHGLRACWSTPIFDEQRHVLGSFALYFQDPGSPDEHHLKQIATVAHTASIAIVKHREQAALAAAEQRLRLAIDAGKVGIWEREIQTKRLLWSSQMQQIVGRPLEGNVPSEKLLESVHPDDRLRVTKAAQQALSQPKDAKAEFRVVWPDGSVHWIAARGRAEFGPNGQPVYVRGVGLDITERKQMEEDLRVRETLLEDAQQVANFGSYEWLPDSNAVRWSNELFRIFGLQPGEFQPTLGTYLEHVHPEDRESARQRIEQAIRENTDFGGEERIVRPDGSTRVLLSEGRWLFDENRQIKKLVGTCQDITTRKEAERSRLRMEDELRQMQKMESIGRLAAGVAHDFNNLLSVIFGHVALYQQELSPGSPVSTHVSQIEQAARRAATLTRHLLAFSRRQVICPTVLELNAVVNNLNKMMRRVIGEHIALRIVPGQFLGTIRADWGQIDQILMNLLVNSVDAMPTGGEIVIETSNFESDDHSPGEVPAVEPGRYVVLSVTDNGSGMDRETMAQIFEPFFTTKARGEGTGLGLSMVYGAVKQNNGHITVSSEVGKGTTFNIFFPRVDQAPEATPARTGETYRKGGETILLVEDDEALRQSTASLLGAQGYQVLVANNGSSALALARGYTDKIHLLVTDVVMPEMSGPELVTQLKAYHPGLGVLYMSGYAGRRLSQHGLLEAETGLLPKPFTQQDLLVRVDALLAPCVKP